jgi:hypothetical protein
MSILPCVLWACAFEGSAFRYVRAGFTIFGGAGAQIKDSSAEIGTFVPV